MADIKLITSTKRPASAAFRKPLKSENPRDVLADIFELLEGYGPIWYTEELHNRAENALLERCAPVQPPRT